MIKAKYVCSECKKEVIVKFKAGETPACPKCCNKDMIRQYGTVKLGDTVDEQMIHLAQSMLYS